MVSEIPCLFCFSKATPPEEYPDDSVRFEAEEIYKLLCSLLNVKLKQNEDIFYLLWTTNAFIPLCKTCSILFRNFSELKVIQQKLKLLAEEIRVKVQNSERDGSSKSGLEFGIGAVGPSSVTGSAKQTRDWLRGIQKFRQSVVQGKSANSSSQYFCATEQIRNVFVEDVQVNDSVIERPEETEPLEYFDDKDIVKKGMADSINSKNLVLVDLEKIIRIKPETENEEMNITEFDENSAEDEEWEPWEDEGHDHDTETTESDEEEIHHATNNLDWRKSINTVKPTASEKVDDDKMEPLTQESLTINKTEKNLSNRKDLKRRNVILAEAETIPKTGGYKCEHCGVDFVLKSCLLRHTDKYHEDVTISAHPNQKGLSNPPVTKTSEKSKWEYPYKKRRIYFQDPKKPKRIKCKQCNEDFASSSSVRRHVTRFHMDNKNLDKKSISDQNKTKNITKTQARKIVKKPFKCPQCPQKFAFERSIAKHTLRFHTGPKSSTNMNLTPWQMRYWPQEDKPAKCDHCDTVFANSVSLTRHIRRISLGPRVLTKTFESSAAESDNLASQTNDPEKMKRICSICKEVFLSESSLRCHKRSVHLKSTVFECSGCKRTFNRSDNLKAHQKRMKH